MDDDFLNQKSPPKVDERFIYMNATPTHRRNQAHTGESSRLPFSPLFPVNAVNRNRENILVSPPSAVKQAQHALKLERDSKQQLENGMYELWDEIDKYKKAIAQLQSENRVLAEKVHTQQYRAEVEPDLSALALLTRENAKNVTPTHGGSQAYTGESSRLPLSPLFPVTAFNRNIENILVSPPSAVKQAQHALKLERDSKHLLQHDMDELSDENDKYKETIAQLQSENRVLAEKACQQQQYRAEVEDGLPALELSSSENAKNVVKIKELQKSLCDKNEISASLRQHYAELEDVHAKLLQANTSAENLQQQIFTLRVENRDFSEKCDVAADKIRVYEAELSKCYDLRARLAATVRALERDCAEKDDDLRESQRQYERLAESQCGADDAQRDTRSLHDQLLSVNTSLVEGELQLNELLLGNGSSVPRAEIQIEQLTKENEEIRNNLDRLEVEYRKLADELEQKQHDLDVLNALIVKLNTEIGCLKDARSQAGLQSIEQRNAIDLLQRKLDAAAVVEAAAEEKMANICALLKDVQSNSAKVQEERDKVVLEASVHEKTCQDLKKELTTCRETCEQQCAVFQAKLQSTMEELQQLIASDALLQAERKIIVDKHHVSQRQCDEMRCKAEQLQLRLNDSTAAEQLVLTLTSERDACQNKLDAQCREAMAEHAQFERDMHVAVTAKELIEIKLQEYEKQHEAHKEQVGILEAEIVTLNAALVETNRRGSGTYEALQQKLSTTEKKSAGLHAALTPTEAVVIQHMEVGSVKSTEHHHNGMRANSVPVALVDEDGVLRSTVLRLRASSLAEHAGRDNTLRRVSAGQDDFRSSAAAPKNFGARKRRFDSLCAAPVDTETSNLHAQERSNIIALRNERMLPHMRSSYAVGPNILPDRVDPTTNAGTVPNVVAKRRSSYIDHVAVDATLQSETLLRNDQADSRSSHQPASKGRRSIAFPVAVENDDKNLQQNAVRSRQAPLDVSETVSSPPRTTCSAAARQSTSRRRSNGKSRSKVRKPFSALRKLGRRLRLGFRGLSTKYNSLDNGETSSTTSGDTDHEQQQQQRAGRAASHAKSTALTVNVSSSKKRKT